MANRVELSNGWVVGTGNMCDRLMSRNENIPGYDSSILIGSAGVLNTYTNTSIRIMKGAFPTNVNDFNYTYRNTDMLINFVANANHFSPSQYTVNPVVISSVFVSAIATGTATWFMIFTGCYTGYINNVTSQAGWGEIGILGSGEDLEMVDVNIIQGSTYKINGMKISFPTMWEY